MVLFCGTRLDVEPTVDDSNLLRDAKNEHEKGRMDVLCVTVVVCMLFFSRTLC